MDYTQYISESVNSIPRSGIRDFFELVIGRDDVISLGVGEPDFKTPWNIREAAIYSLEKGHTTYTSNLGLLSLRKEISRYVSDLFKLEYDPEKEILVTVGVSEAMDLALRALVNPGDEVIYHEPCYVSYSPSITMAHGKAVAVTTKKENGFAVQASEIEAVLTEKSKVLILNYPTNPTGALADPIELKKIADLCVKHDLIVLTDEIYSELTYEGDPGLSIAAYPKMKERTIFLHGFSKAFAMTGFRLGYVCAPPALIDAMMKIHQYAMLCAPITSQAAATEALMNGADAVAKMKESYQSRRNYVVDRLNGMGLDCHLPGGAFYVFPEVKKFGLSSHDFALQLLQSQKVAAVPGNAFGAGGEGFLRACYATSFDQLEVAMDKMETFVKTLS